MSTATEPSVYFGERARRYDREYEGIDFSGYALRSRMAAVVRLLGSGPGDVLDAGMGPGRLCWELALRNWRVSGVDAAPEMVAAARQRLPKAAERLACGNVEKLSFADRTFDAVVATGVLEYVDLESALSEIERVLKPGGLAVFSYPNTAAFYGLWKTRVFYPVIRRVKRVLGLSPLLLATAPPTFTPERVRALVAAAGLRLDGREFAGFAAIPSPLDDLAPKATVTVGRVLERRGRRLSGLLATQIVYAARKAAP